MYLYLYFVPFNYTCSFLYIVPEHFLLSLFLTIVYFLMIVIDEFIFSVV